MVFEPAAPADTDVKRDGIYLNRDDLILTEGPATVSGDWPILSIRIHGL